MGFDGKDDRNEVNKYIYGIQSDNYKLLDFIGAEKTDRIYPYKISDIRKRHTYLLKWILGGRIFFWSINRMMADLNEELKMFTDWEELTLKIINSETERLTDNGVPEHIAKHIAVYDRISAVIRLSKVTDDIFDEWDDLGDYEY